MKTIKAFLYTVCLITAMVGIWNLFVMKQSTEEATELYDGLAEVRENAAEPETVEEALPEETVVRNTWLEELREQNPDLVGWLTIDGTKIDYPVVQSGEDEAYYLTHNFNGKQDGHGTPFLDAACEVDVSDNLVIYGHHMQDGSMFQNLMNYRNPGFCETHSEILLQDLYHDHSFRVVLVMVISAAEAQSFPYYRCTDFENEAVYDYFLTRCEKYSIWKSEELPSFGQKLITLSTCEYSKTDGRLVVIGCE